MTEGRDKEKDKERERERSVITTPREVSRMHRIYTRGSRKALVAECVAEYVAKCVAGDDDVKCLTVVDDSKGFVSCAFFFPEHLCIWRAQKETIVLPNFSSPIKLT